MNRIILIVALGFVLGACQAVFTYSPFTSLQRDIGSLSSEQKVKRAEDALGTGDVAQIGEAYEVIAAILEASDTPDPELTLLAADLAFAGSGVSEVLTSVLQDPEALSGAPTEDLIAMLDALDVALIAEGATHIQNAVAADAEVSSTQYVIAGASLLASAVEQAGSFEAVVDPLPTDAWYQDVLDAERFLTEGGAADLLEMFNL